MIHGTSLDRRFPEDQREIVATTQARLINEMVALFPLIRENAEGKSTLRQPNPGDPVNIMISYNWDTSQDRAIMLANALKEKAAQSPAEIGNVWIDVDNMDGVTQDGGFAAMDPLRFSINASMQISCITAWRQHWRHQTLCL
eukprot:m.112477 g.112477  ORF g.112477 m.112477 type:complete len:142 (-) comp9397_c0_seq1:562-987(-)